MSELICILQRAWTDSIKRIKSFRYVSAILMVLGLVLAVTSGIDRLINDVGENVTVWIVPHIFDNVYFSAFYGIIICYLLSEIPYFNSNELFYIVRMGRGRWFLSKAVSILITMFIFTVTSFAICIFAFFPKNSFAVEWGKVIKTMAYSTNLYSYNLLCQASGVIITKYEPVMAMIMCFFMVWMVSTMIGYMMFAISIYWNRIISIVGTLVIALLGLSEGLFFTIKVLPYFSVFTWYRMSLYGEPVFLDWYYPEFSKYIIMTLGMMFLFFLLSFIKIRHIEFDWINES